MDLTGLERLLNCFFLDPFLLCYHHSERIPPVHLKSKRSLDINIFSYFAI